MTMKLKAAIPLLAATAIGLTACEEGQFLAAPPAEGEATVGAPQQARTEIRDVERADIFSASELALWDGRPSLGGLWVAHPEVSDPERVRITNATNGQTVFGALFRRERNNPGPRIQLSSDAASALGILAGQPTELSIVAVRQEEVTIEPAPLPIEDIEETPADEEGGVAAAELNEATANTASEPPKRQGFFARLFGGGAAADEATDEAETLEGAIAPAVETEPLDPITTSAAAAIDAAEATSATLSATARPQRRAVAAVATSAPAAAPAPAPEPVATPAPAATPAPSLSNPYVQVGLFTVEANASAAATGLRQGGIVPTIVPGTNASGAFWRVLVGPMTNPSDQSEILSQVKSLGYSDAFLVSN